MRVIIAGSRGIKDPCLVLDALLEAGFEITEVVSGAADGVDLLGELIAAACQIPVKQFFPKYQYRNDRKAPLRRNTEMAKYADALIAVWNGTSTGTADMIRKAELFKLKAYVKNTTLVL
jgi:hypothetical protein